MWCPDCERHIWLDEVFNNRLNELEALRLKLEEKLYDQKTF